MSVNLNSHVNLYLTKYTGMNICSPSILNRFYWVNRCTKNHGLCLNWSVRRWDSIYKGEDESRPTGDLPHKYSSPLIYQTLSFLSSKDCLVFKY